MYIYTLKLNYSKLKVNIFITLTCFRIFIVSKLNHLKLKVNIFITYTCIFILSKLNYSKLNVNILLLMPHYLHIFTYIYTFKVKLFQNLI
jgi:hypothetical protein